MTLDLGKFKKELKTTARLISLVKEIPPKGAAMLVYKDSSYSGKALIELVLLFWRGSDGHLHKYSCQKHIVDIGDQNPVTRIMSIPPEEEQGMVMTIDDRFTNVDEVDVIFGNLDNILPILREAVYVYQHVLDESGGVIQRSNGLLSEEEIDQLKIALISSQKDQKTMTTQVSRFNSLAARSKSAGVSAIEYQAGKALNVAVIAAIKPKLPMMARGYADHAAAPVIIAMAMAMAVEFLPDGAAKDKAVKATDLMLGASFMEGADKLFNVEKLINDVLGKLPKEVNDVLSSPND